MSKENKINGEVVNETNFSARKNSIPEMIEILKAYRTGKKIERRPFNKVVVVAKDGFREENVKLEKISSSDRYVTKHGFIINSEDIDHIEILPWMVADFPDFNFAEDQYRIKDDQV